MNDIPSSLIPQASRRGVMVGGLAAAAVVAAPRVAGAVSNPQLEGMKTMGLLKVTEGVEIFYKDWGPKQAPVIWFHHGWPLSSDDWDNQMMFFLGEGFRVIAHDRRGHGRSTQTDTGNEMDTYAADVAALARHLDVRGAVHVGHSTGGGEACRYVARHGGGGRASKLVLIGAVPPIMLRTAAYPGGLPMEVFDGFRAGVAGNRAQNYIDIPSGPFYGFNRPGATVSQGLIDNWWRQGMMGGVKAHYDCVKAFSETDFTDDLKSIEQPTLILHGEDDQVVPIANSAHLAINLVRNGRLKTYPGLPHGMCSTHPEVVNPELLAFARG